MLARGPGSHCDACPWAARGQHAQVPHADTAQPAGETKPVRVPECSAWSVSHQHSQLIRTFSLLSFHTLISTHADRGIFKKIPVQMNSFFRSNAVFLIAPPTHPWVTNILCSIPCVG